MYMRDIFIKDCEFKASIKKCVNYYLDTGTLLTLCSGGYPVIKAFGEQ